MREGGKQYYAERVGRSNKKEMRGTVRLYDSHRARCGTTAHRCAARIARECAAAES